MVTALPRVSNSLCFSLECGFGIPLRATVDIAERFRQSAIKRFKRSHGSSAHSFALSGHEPKPAGVSGDHMHAHFLPLSENASLSGNLRELHVWAPCGFTQSEVEALMQVKTLHWGTSEYPIRPVLTAIDRKSPAVLSPEPANIWQSLTPFVPPRHFYRGNLHGAKLKQKDSPENQLVAEIARLGIDTPFEINRVPLNTGDLAGTEAQSLWDIARIPGDNPAFEDAVLTEAHAHGVEKERRIGFMFRLNFDHPVSLSRLLGHSSHFGLGLFVPMADLTLSIG